MKLIKANITRLDSLYIGGEPEAHYQNRRVMLVDDAHVLAAGEEDIDTLEGWDEYQGATGKDFQYVVDKMKSIAAAITTPTTEENAICCKHILIPKADRLAIVSGADDRANYDRTVSALIEARKTRIEIVACEIGYHLEANAQDVEKITQDLYNGYAMANRKDLLDFFKSEGDYTGTGFSSKTYYDQDVKNTVIELLTNGK